MRWGILKIHPWQVTNLVVFRYHFQISQHKFGYSLVMQVMIVHVNALWNGAFFHSGTCPPLAVYLISTSILYFNTSMRVLDYLLQWTSFIRNPNLLYSMNVLLIPFYSSSTDRLLSHTIYWYLMVLSITTSIRISFINMRFIQCIRSLCCSMSSGDIYTR